MARGKLIVISGPSGVGKSSICQRLVQRLPDATLSVSATTRPLRGGEIDGANYHFVSRETFGRMRAKDEFLESAEYLGEFYGTPAAPVREALGAGRNIILEIEVKGGAQVAVSMPESIRVFVLSPTAETLEARLSGRGTESAERQAKRLAEADGEIAFAQEENRYTHFVTNDDLDATVDEIIQIIKNG